MYWGVFTVSIIACFKRIMCPNFTKNVKKSCANSRYDFDVRKKIGEKLDKKAYKTAVFIVFVSFRM